MNEMQDIDFKNPSKEVLFKLCMGEIKAQTRNEVLERFGLDHLKTEEVPSKEFNIDELKEIVGEYKLLTYTDLLFDYQKKWIIRNKLISKYKKEFYDEYIDNLKYHLEVSKIVKMFLSRELSQSKNLKVTYTDLFDKIDTVNENILDQIQEIYIKEFERLKLNETEYTREEAIKEIEEVEDVDFFIEYGNPHFYDGLKVNMELVPDEFIKHYMAVHYKPRVVTLEMVEKVIDDIESYFDEKKEGPGAKIKNLEIGELAKRLYYLKRIQSFFSDNKLTSIKQLKMSNQAYRFIYDYFEFWDLLHEDVRYDEYDNENRIAYIKSLIRNNRGFTEKGKIKLVTGHTIIDTLLESRIDLFKKVKNGVISQDEYFERLANQ